jgi:hypothetical protein
MRPSSKWMVLLTLAALFGLTVSAVLPVAPAFAASPRAKAQDSSGTRYQIVVLDSAGRVQVIDPVDSSRNWSSGTDTGWARIATGDFKGDGHAEVVAMKGSDLKIFDPSVTTGVTPAVWDGGNPDSSSGRGFRLLVTGDFDGDGRDEIAFTKQVPNSGNEDFYIYDGNSTGSGWHQVYYVQFDGAMDDIKVGNINADTSGSGYGYQDLLMYRTSDNIVRVIFGGSYSTSSFDYNSSYPLAAINSGKLSTSYAGDQMILSRVNFGDAVEAVVYQRYDTTNSAFYDLVTGLTAYPAFTSVAAGDVNGDGKDEALLLRDPETDKESLVVQDLSGGGGTSGILFQPIIGYGDTRWNLVRGGDVNADGYDEIVLLRSDKIRIYYGSNHSFALLSDISGSYIVDSMALAPIYGPSVAYLSASVSSMAFSLAWGAASPIKSVALLNKGIAGTITWRADVTGGDTWLRVNGGTSVTGITPDSLSVTVDSMAKAPLPSGSTYKGEITLYPTAPSGTLPSSITIKVTLALTDSGFTAVPSTLEIWQATTGPVTSTTSLIVGYPGGTSTSWVALATTSAAAEKVLAGLANGSVKITPDGKITGSQFPAVPWVTVNPASGTLGTGTATGMKQNVTVTVSRDGLSNGVRDVVLMFVPTGTGLSTGRSALRYVLLDKIYGSRLPAGFN